MKHDKVQLMRRLSSDDYIILPTLFERETV